MIKHTANYSHSNHNFVIQNLEGQRIDNEYLPVVCILKNILQRGRPTLMSKFLQEQIGVLHKSEDFQHSYPLIDQQPPKWERIIRGAREQNYFPAQKFFEDLIPKHLSEYKFIQQLIIPEMPINEITQVRANEFKNEQVDFYLPQAYLIIEIDGESHDEKKDKRRDHHTARYGIKTVRIKTTDLEAENESFQQAIAAIKKRIENVILAQNKRRKGNSVFLSINDYKAAYENGVDLEIPAYKATAIIRFQMLILELLEKGLLDFNKAWNFELHCPGNKNFADLAIQDLFYWLMPLFKLHKIEWEKPKYSIHAVDSIDAFPIATEAIQIDFSLTRRYTDENQTYPHVLFVRTDYLDEYLYYTLGNARGNMKFSSYEPYDYFKVSTTKTTKYKLQLGGEDSDEKALLFLLQNIFLQEITEPSFNEGQLGIIANALTGHDTIGLLPTGSGKSVCYQLAAILQPAISFVVCPIKSLIYDQKAELDLCGFTRVNHITSDLDGEEKDKIQKEFSIGKYLFLLISPERFQKKEFREYFSTVQNDFSIAYAVIDEVHCLSEWGHDFRLAYLNLSSTLRNLCKSFNFIGLTATASINVLKDIQVEFGIDQRNIKTPENYTRKELDFEILDDGGNKEDAIKQLLEEMNMSEGFLTPDGQDSKCGIIFTPTVNGRRGCYPLSVQLSTDLKTDVKYYSGSIPKGVNMDNKKYDKYKKKVQEAFKANHFTLLTATKAFGMGVNKPNIHFTAHYGIPASMEALYQEGGRAGRDKVKFNEQQAKCYVLLSRSTNRQATLDELWKRETSLPRVKALIKQINGDLNTNFFLFSTGMDVIKKEYEIVKNLHNRFSVANEKNVLVTGDAIRVKKHQAEKAIYRLSQLGIIQDWTISNFFGGGTFEVDFADYNSTTSRNSLLHTIHKYDPGFSFDSLQTENRYAIYQYILNNAPSEYSDFDKDILILLQWSYDNFAYNRRQSLKNLYENCCEFADEKITKDEFKIRLENYFKFKEASYVLQHIAENPGNIEKWFDVFYVIENNQVTENFLSERQIGALRDNLSRFLESYMYNPGLDLISGLVRLWLDEYDNIDGRERLHSSLEQIKHYDAERINYIMNQIFNIGRQMTDKNKNRLAESLYQYFSDNSFLHRIHKELGDTFSRTTIIDTACKKLETINNKIYDGFRKVG